MHKWQHSHVFEQIPYHKVRKILKMEYMYVNSILANNRFTVFVHRHHFVSSCINIPLHIHIRVYIYLTHV